jgi:hypothetical protein
MTYNLRLKLDMRTIIITIFFLAISNCCFAGLTDGLVGYWTFNGEDMDWSQSTAEARDVSGQNNHGDVTNFGKEGAVIGKVGQALEFDGEDDYVDLGTGALITDSSTVSMWFKMDTISTYYAIFSTASGATDRLSIYTATNGRIVIQVVDGSNNAWATSGDYDNNLWHHMVVVRNGDITGNAVLYIDGSIVSTATFGNSNDSTNNSIGGNDIENSWFKGSLDEVRIYNRALSPEEVQELYQLGARKFQPDSPVTDYLTDGLVGHWTFNGEDMDWSQSTAEARDASGQNNHGDVTNFGQEGAVIGKVGQALEFDGSDDYVSFSSIDQSTGTYAVWINPSGLALDENMFFCHSVSGSYSRIWFEHSGGGDGYLGLETDTNGQTYGSNSINLSLNSWYHIAVARNGDDVYFYLDGLGVGSDNIASADSLTISRVGGISGKPFFNGAMDEVRIYNRVLSPEEVQELYQLGARKLQPHSPITDYLTNGLVGHWTFNGQDMDWGQSTAEARDVSGQNNHGDVVGFGEEGAVIGKVGQALEFDGEDDYVGVTHQSYFTQVPFTASAWFKLDQLPSAKGNYEFIIDKKDSSGPPWHAWILYVDNPSNKIDFFVTDSSGSGSGYILSDSAVSTNTWYHAVATIDSSYNMKLFVDGSQQIGTDNPGSIYTSDSYLVLGSEGTGYGYELDGLIDEVRVYNRALSPEEVQELYQLGARKFQTN